MKIDIYTSIKNGSKNISVPKGTKIDSISFPFDLDPDLLTLSPFRTRLEVVTGKAHSALDQDDVIKQIEEKGYAIHGAKTLLDLGSKADLGAKKDTASTDAS
ncbi:MAG: hypothetical protein ACJATV_001617 [Granulosicoccus sp.]